jgi:large subunit ribosomal protein L18
MSQQELVAKRRLRRQRHVRKKLFGTQERPRLAVHRTLKHIYAQIIDDDKAITLVSANTMNLESAGDDFYGGNKDAAALVGTALAEKAKAAGITQVCFDRRSYKYHGRVKALADAARSAGLNF